MMEEQVVLVDREDRPVGTAGKLAAHRRGLLHRAVSVVLFDPSDRVLIQQRAAGKYHSAGLWSNTCCGHPRPGEAPLQAALRRLHEEMGIPCRLHSAGILCYRAEVDGALVEHEVDHVFIGRFGGTPDPDPGEVAGWRWESVGNLLALVEHEPQTVTAWFSGVLDLAVRHAGAAGA